MRRSAVLVLGSVLAVAAATAIAPASAAPTAVATGTSTTAAAPGSQQYVVLYKSAGPSASARAAIKAAGGTIVSENTEVGFAVVRSGAASFSTDGRPGPPRCAAPRGTGSSATPPRTPGPGS